MIFTSTPLWYVTHKVSYNLSLLPLKKKRHKISFVRKYHIPNISVQILPVFFFFLVYHSPTLFLCIKKKKVYVGPALPVNNLNYSLTETFSSLPICFPWHPLIKFATLDQCNHLPSDLTHWRKPNSCIHWETPNYGFQL